jgi:hypothetical protein
MLSYNGLQNFKMFKFIRPFLAFIALSIPLLCNAATYYISPTGNNANPGTQTTPWATIQYSVNQLKAGDMLYVMGGTYPETVTISSSGTQSSPINVIAYPGQTPVIDGATLTVGNWQTLLHITGAYVNVSGFEVRNMNLNGAVLGGYGISLEGVGDVASNMVVHDIWSIAIISQNDNQVIQDSTVYRAGLVNCRLASAAA